MLLRSTSLIVLSFALIQCVYTVPLPVTSTSELDARVEIAKLTVNHFISMAKFIVEEGKLILQKTLKDNSITEANIHNYKQQLEYITQLLESIDNFERNCDFDQNGELLKLMIEFNTFLQMYDISKKQNPTNDEIFFAQLLRSNGVDHLSLELEKRFFNFLQEFSPLFDQYVEQLDGQQKEKALDWYKRLNADKDSEKKIFVFIEFLNLLKSEI